MVMVVCFMLWRVLWPGVAVLYGRRDSNSSNRGFLPPPAEGSFGPAYGAARKPGTVKSAGRLPAAPL